MTEYTLIPAAPGHLFIQARASKAELDDEQSPDIYFVENPIIGWRVPTSNEISGRWHEQYAVIIDGADEQVRCSSAVYDYGTEFSLSGCQVPNGAVYFSDKMMTVDDFKECATCLLASRLKQHHSKEPTVIF